MVATDNYLYGVAVQGIQNFIFQTNKLKDIVGASELVEEICTTLFASTLYDEDIDYNVARSRLKEDERAVLFAAGNIKYIFQSWEECERVARVFPQKVALFAPGVTVSQAVVKMGGDKSTFGTAVSLLENRLRVQRNRPIRSQTLGLMGILRSRQTGLPVVDVVKGDYCDAAKLAKLRSVDTGTGKSVDRKTTLNLCKKAFGLEDLLKTDIANDIEKLTKDNDWIAVIHADGNGLGQIVKKVGKDAEDFKLFSQNLDEATTSAAVTAFQRVVCPSDKEVIPVRPIVLGGDDLTIVCRADLALAYTKAFIEEFEKETKGRLGELIRKYEVFVEDKNYLTACAGIAYIKSSYPFYYGYELAESL